MIIHYHDNIHYFSGELEAMEFWYYFLERVNIQQTLILLSTTLFDNSGKVTEIAKLSAHD